MALAGAGIARSAGTQAAAAAPEDSHSLAKTSTSARGSGSVKTRTAASSSGHGRQHNPSIGSTGSISETNPMTDTDPFSGTRTGGFGHGGFGRGDFGRGGFGGGFGHGGGLIVTGVSGSTITATAHRAQTVDVQVTATTVYTEAGASASLSDVKAGEAIAVQTAGGVPMPGRPMYGAPLTGTQTITATGVTIILPRVSGVVSAVGASSLTLSTLDGVTKTVTLTSATRYQKAGQTVALSDVTLGTAVTSEGPLSADGSLAAVRVTIALPHLFGRVASVNGSTITLSGERGVTKTMTTSGSTTYVNADGSAATASAVKVDSFIGGEGVLSSDGKTLSALRVIVGWGKGPGGQDGGPDGRGGFGGPGGGRHGGPDGGFYDGDQNGSTGSATPSTPSSSSSSSATGSI